MMSFALTQILVEFHQVLSPVDKSGAWWSPLKQNMLLIYKHVFFLIDSKSMEMQPKRFQYYSSFPWSYGEFCVDSGDIKTKNHIMEVARCPYCLKTA